MKHIPNFITSLNLASGFIAIIFAANGDLVTASWLILAAMIFDFFDGFSARLLRAYSEIGKELDSLADIVSFGIAPALILYELLIASANINILPGQGPEPVISSVLAYITVLMPVCSALRLAKFNVDETQTKSFKGLPTPANAIAVVSVVIAANYSSIPVMKSFIESPAALIIYTIVLSVLMVTNLPLLSNKFTSLKFAGNEARYILIVIVLILFLIFGLTAAPLLIPVYIIISLISNSFRTKIH
jgi:CDP-diacylglycerol---serine O-phosphatidyltransferase